MKRAKRAVAVATPTLAVFAILTGVMNTRAQTGVFPHASGNVRALPPGGGFRFSALPSRALVVSASDALKAALADSSFHAGDVDAKIGIVRALVTEPGMGRRFHPVKAWIIPFKTVDWAPSGTRFYRWCYVIDGTTGKHLYEYAADWDRYASRWPSSPVAVERPRQNPPMSQREAMEAARALSPGSFRRRPWWGQARVTAQFGSVDLQGVHAAGGAPLASPGQRTRGWCIRPCVPAGGISLSPIELAM